MCFVRKPDIVNKVWHSCVDRLLPKICLNYKYLLLSSPWHLEGQISETLRTIILLGKSEKEKELINYFKSYSSLGDDRFFLCHPVHVLLLCRRLCAR